MTSLNSSLSVGRRPFIVDSTSPRISAAVIAGLSPSSAILVKVEGTVEYVALSTSGRDVLLSCAGAWILVRMRVVVFGAVQSLAPPQRRLLGVNCV